MTTRLGSTEREIERGEKSMDQKDLTGSTSIKREIEGGSQSRFYLMKD